MKKEVIRQFEERNIPVAKSSILTLREWAEIIFSNTSPDKIFLNSEDAELIISQIIQENAAEVPLFFPNNRISPKIVRELVKFISTLINRKTEYPECLGNLQNEKSRQLALIYQLYLSYLRENNLIDQDLLLVQVIDSIGKKGIILFEDVFVYGIYDPLPLEQDFIKKISEHTINFQYALPWSN
ncbi:MAG: hypothetical protein Q8T08_08650, partial [Ignavibacteria bacterium]|nr:hypothetical protein [Ignavibacteria bacterium]